VRYESEQREANVACDEWGEKLDRYLDGELAPAEAAALSAHLRGCAGCTAEVLERVQIKRSVQAAGRRYAPRLVLIPALLVLVAAFLLNSYIGRERAGQERVYSELADLHVATLASAAQVDVVSSDRHTVKPWFQGKIPFTFNLPELPGSEFSLVGGRVAYLEQVSGAHLIYQIREHEISVFIFPERESEMSSLPSGLTNAASFNLETWTQNGLRYFVIGDASADDIRALSKLLRSAA
jgi:anti-sigma factor RsiW